MRGELGALVETYRPVRPLLGCLTVLAVPLAIGVAVSFAPPGPLVGALLFAALGVPLLYAFGHVAFVEYQFYEHGLTVVTRLWGMPSFVLPYYSCSPGPYSFVGRSARDVPGNEAAVTYRLRQSPFIKTAILLWAINEADARALANGTAPWRAGIRRVTLGGRTYTEIGPRQVWTLATRNPEHHAELLSGLVRADHAGDPDVDSTEGVRYTRR